MAEQDKSIIITRYTAENENLWNQFVADAKRGLFMFDRNYMEYHSDRFKDHSLLFWKGEELVALLPANEKDNIIASHGGLTYGGLVINEKAKQHIVIDCINELKKYIKAEGIKHIVYKTVPHIYHLQPAEEDLYALYQQGGDVANITTSTVVDLRDPIEMQKLRRRQINKARKNGVTIRELESKDDYMEFMAFAG